MSSDVRFPIGKFAWPETISGNERRQMIETLASAPARLREAVAGFSEDRLDTPYRDGGWSVRQVIHHVPESHMNSYIRFKLALTENEPLIKPYDEDAWARTPEIAMTPVDASLRMLEALHERWVVLLGNLSETEWQKQFRHPELGLVPLDKALALYAWHGDHHVAHVTALRARMGW